MYQAVGKIVVNGEIIGFTLYDLQSGKIMGIPVEKCKEGVKKGIIKNLEILSGELITTDGMLPNLPTYDRTGRAKENSQPVIIERFVIGNDNKTVGFSYIVNGEYRRGTSEELLRKYSKFYNAKTYTSSKVPIIASKRGSFYIVKLREDDFIIENGVLKAYKGKSKKVIIPNEVTVIANNVFKGNSTITSVILPKDLKEIGDNAFLDCLSLQSIIVPDSIVKIGKYSFKNCRSLIKVKLSDNLKEIGVSTFENCLKLREIDIPKSVIGIGNYAFDNCISLKRVELPHNLIEIGNYAFRNTAVERIVFPSGLSVIGANAFYGCSNLVSVIIPNSVNDMKNGVFQGCDWDCKIKCNKGSYAYNFVSSYYPQYLDVI